MFGERPRTKVKSRSRRSKYEKKYRYFKTTFYLFSEVTDIFTFSRDPEELKFTWIEWHNAAGAPSKGNYTEYVDISNKTAQLNGRFFLILHSCYF